MSETDKINNKFSKSIQLKFPGKPFFAEKLVSCYLDKRVEMGKNENEREISN